MYYELLILIAISLGGLYMVRFIRDRKYEKNEEELGNETKMEELNESATKKDKMVEEIEGIWSCLSILFI